jgi:L-alanine-DL-glutamate epimerase-like enolase superfamily enzyme
MACLDIAGQAAGLSLPDLLGGRYETGTRIMSSVSSGPPDYMMEIIEKYRKMGYRGHSVKVGGSDIELDIRRIRHIEQNRLEGERILYDVNRAWTRREASIVMNAVADLGVTFEQPCETTDDIKAVRAVTTSPISVDESLVSLNDMVRIAHEGIADVAGIKINRVGGLTKAKRIRDVAIAHGIQIYVMATGGSVLADAEAASLAQTIPDEFRLGCWACQDMLTVDVAPGRGPRSQHGELRIPDLPGLGFSPDESLLGKPVAVYAA